MLLISIFLQLIRSDCPDYQIPSHSRSFINSLRSLKSSRTMLLFGVDSYADFPVVNSFDELKDKVLPFLMGQFYTNFLILILGIVAFFFFLSCTILITTCCTPRERSKPGFFTTIIWWIIFSILFLVAIIYFILSIAFAPNFINNFHEIPEIVQNSFTQIINSTNQYISKYEENVINNINGFDAVYPSMALLMSSSYTSTIQSFINHLNSLSGTLERINECDESDEQLNCTYLSEYITTFNKGFIDIRDDINKFIHDSCSNTISVYRQNRLTIPVLYDFSNLKWVDAQMSITKYRYNEVEKSKKSFDTDHDYVNIPLKAINVVLLILVIVFYVFQTITFFTQWAFSRCCVIAIYPIAMVASFGIAVFGIFATSVSCAIGDVCSDSTRFTSQYFFLRNETRDNYPFPIYNPNLFNSPNNNLFTAIGGEYLFNFDDIITIENSSEGNDEVVLNCKLTTDIPSELNNSDKYPYSRTYEELMKLYEILGHRYQRTVIEGKDDNQVLRDIRNVIESISDVNYKYALQFHIISILQDHIDFNPYNYKEGYFNRSINEFIPFLRNLTEKETLVDTSAFTCPVRDTKKILCKDTASTFSCFSIFAHFYILSLIGFGIVLCFRRQGMLSINYGLEDEETEKKKDRKKDKSSDYEPRTTDFIKTNQGQSYRDQKAWTLSDASDSESRSSFTTLDMYAQSKIL